MSPEDREALLELTCHADALAFGEDSVWAGRTDKRDYDDRQRTCYEYAARLREERFTFHSSDTFRTYINLAYCAGVRGKKRAGASPAGGRTAAALEPAGPRYLREMQHRRL